MSASGPQVSRDIPILFSAPMVRALIRELEQPGTGKTQTRRLLPLQPPPEVSINYPLGDESWMPANKRSPRRHHFEAWAGPLYGSRPDGHLCGTFTSPQRYRAGDRLWVRETWWPQLSDGVATVSYRANGETRLFGKFPDQWKMPKHAARGSVTPLHMPRWASRLTLTVADVRVQRLQDISEADAVAEGAREYPCEGPHRGPDATYWTMAEPDSPLPVKRLDPVRAFKAFFEELHGEEIWQANPWVCAISFTVERRNIDAKVAA